MKRELAAMVLTLGIVVLPGYLGTRAAVPRAGRLVALGVAAPVGLGLAYVLGIWFTFFHVPVVPRTVLPPLAALAVWGALVEWRTARFPRLTSLNWAVLAAPPLLIVVWLAGMGLPSANLPWDDGTNHAIFTSLIARTHSLRPRDVLLADVPSHELGTHFYPLALHTVAAQLVQLHVTDAGTAFFAVAVVTASVSLPVGLFLVTRALFPTVPIAAPVAALLPLGCSQFPFNPSYNGLFPLIVGVSMAPGIAVWLRSRGDRAWGAVVGALALVGLFGSHTSEVPLAVGMVVALAVWPYRGLRSLVRPALSVVVAVVGLFVLVAPVVVQGAQGTADRFDVITESPPAIARLVLHVLTLGFGTDFAGLVGALLALGAIVVCVVRRWAVGWLVLLLGSVVLYVSLYYTQWGPVRVVGTPWYDESYRIAYNTVVLAMPLAALGFALLVGAARRAAPSPEAARAATVVASVALAVAIGAGAGSTRIDLRSYTAASSVVTAHDRAAFAYLGRHVPPGTRVLNGRPDGGAWMLPLAGVDPVVGARVDAWKGPTWVDRWYMVRHADRAATDPREAALLRQWDVSYVFVGSRRYSRLQPYAAHRWDRTISAAALERSPAYREVFRRGGAHVFEVVRSALAR